MASCSAVMLLADCSVNCSGSIELELCGSARSALHPLLPPLPLLLHCCAAAAGDVPDATCDRLAALGTM